MRRPILKEPPILKNSPFYVENLNPLFFEDFENSNPLLPPPLQKTGEGSTMAVFQDPNQFSVNTIYVFMLKISLVLHARLC